MAIKVLLYIKLTITANEFFALYLLPSKKNIQLVTIKK